MTLTQKLKNGIGKGILVAGATLGALGVGGCGYNSDFIGYGGTYDKKNATIIYKIEEKNLPLKKPEHRLTKINDNGRTLAIGYENNGEIEIEECYINSQEYTDPSIIENCQISFDQIQREIVNLKKKKVSKALK